MLAPPPWRSPSPTPTDGASNQPRAQATPPAPRRRFGRPSGQSPSPQRRIVRTLASSTCQRLERACAMQCSAASRRRDIACIPRPGEIRPSLQHSLRMLKALKGHGQIGAPAPGAVKDRAIRRGRGAAALRAVLERIGRRSKLAAVTLSAGLLAGRHAASCCHPGFGAKRRRPGPMHTALRIGPGCVRGRYLRSRTRARAPSKTTIGGATPPSSPPACAPPPSSGRRPRSHVRRPRRGCGRSRRGGRAAGASRRRSARASPPPGLRASA